MYNHVMTVQHCCTFQEVLLKFATVLSHSFKQSVSSPRREALAHGAATAPAGCSHTDVFEAGSCLLVATGDIFMRPLGVST